MSASEKAGVQVPEQVNETSQPVQPNYARIVNFLYVLKFVILTTAIPGAMYIHNLWRVNLSLCSVVGPLFALIILGGLVFIQEVIREIKNTQEYQQWLSDSLGKAKLCITLVELIADAPAPPLR